MVAETESSDSLAGSSNSASQKPTDGHLDKRSLDKAPKKNHKAEREKLKRDQLNDLFIELSSMLDLDRQNSGKSTVLGDAARVLRELITQVESLREEQSVLLTEHQYNEDELQIKLQKVGLEKNELQDENTTLKSQIIVLQNELRTRIENNNLNLSSLVVSHPIESSNANLVTHTMPHHTWNSGSSLSTLPMMRPRPLQNQSHDTDGSHQVYTSRPQELQLFPGTSVSPGRHKSTPATLTITDTLPEQLCLSLPRASQEESSSGGASDSGKERNNS